ncbi:MAG TPA: GDSL-type esterase/lipase family protein [Verrucomicrobiales bacterium]|nr:GDSL-type esterase/lipase family protein [Verrucomicrobiales bacterium]
MPGRFFVILFVWVSLLRSGAEESLLWDVTRLTGTLPPSEQGIKSGLSQEVWYEGEPFGGKSTRVFAYLSRPEGASKDKPAPAMLLVHGGGGKAFKEWAEHWAKRGYVALAMDTAGQGPDGKHHDKGGPDQSDNTKFRNFTDADAREMWSYHAVAAVLRGHALLNSLPEVDRGRVGVTGISWGGYLTCLVAGLDHGLKVAVPVYGCGFLGNNSYWRDRSLAAMDQDARERWLRLFDPSTTAGKTECPILFLNGTHDFAYPPDSYRKTFSLVKPELRTVSVRVDLPHGHIWTFKEVDAFVDHVLKPDSDSPALPGLSEITQDNNSISTRILNGAAVAKAELHYTTMTGNWQQRQWKSMPANLRGGEIQALLPAESPLTYFFTVTDSRGLMTSTAYAETGAFENTACLPKGKLEQDFYEWDTRHAAVLTAKDRIQPDIVLIGDSITHLWGGEPQDPKGNRGAKAWQALFGERKVLNAGFGWDRTQNVLWRIGHGELDGLNPKLIVIHIGTNNLAGTKNARANTPAEIAEGIQAVTLQAKAKCPAAKIVLMAVFPRGEKPENPDRARIDAINTLLPAVAKTCGATLIDLKSRFLEGDGTISKETMPDFLHPAEKGYGIWAEALKEHLPK